MSSCECLAKAFQSLHFTRHDVTVLSIRSGRDYERSVDRSIDWL